MVMTMAPLTQAGEAIVINLNKVVMRTHGGHACVLNMSHGLPCPGPQTAKPTVPEEREKSEMAKFRHGTPGSCPTSFPRSPAN